MIKYINCCHCGIHTELPKSNPYKKFCSIKCGALFQNKDKINLLAIEYEKSPNICFTCECNLPYSKRHNKYCSRSCSAKTTKNNTTHGKYIITEKECIICKSITTNNKVCSTSCREILLSKPRKYFTEEERLHAKRAIQREANARYCAKKKYNTPVDEDLSAIKLFYRNCPPGYEVDHKTPISKGGAHSLVNMQYLTISDNRKKHAKLDWCPGGESNARHHS